MQPTLDDYRNIFNKLRDALNSRSETIFYLTKSLETGLLSSRNKRIKEIKLNVSDDFQCKTTGISCDDELQYILSNKAIDINQYNTESMNRKHKQKNIDDQFQGFCHYITTHIAINALHNISVFHFNQPCNSFMEIYPAAMRMYSEIINMMPKSRKYVYKLYNFIQNNQLRFDAFSMMFDKLFKFIINNSFLDDISNNAMISDNLFYLYHQLYDSPNNYVTCNTLCLNKRDIRESIIEFQSSNAQFLALTRIAIDPKNTIYCSYGTRKTSVTYSDKSFAKFPLANFDTNTQPYIDIYESCQTYFIECYALTTQEIFKESSIKTYLCDNENQCACIKSLIKLQTSITNLYSEAFDHLNIQLKNNSPRVTIENHSVVKSNVIDEYCKHVEIKRATHIEQYSDVLFVIRYVKNALYDMYEQFITNFHNDTRNIIKDYAHKDVIEFFDNIVEQYHDDKLKYKMANIRHGYT